MKSAGCAEPPAPVLVLQTFWELLKGLCLAQRRGPGVTVFGSAKIASGSDVYETACALGAALSRAGFDVMTGGGPGLMEAANRGARSVGGRSVGCCVRLSTEQSRNHYLDRRVTFRHFFLRKMILRRHAAAFIALPGGLGTLDELFEVLTLIQTKKLHQIPVILIGREYWEGLRGVLRNMVSHGTIAERDLELFHVTDDIEDAVERISRSVSSVVGWRSPGFNPISDRLREGRSLQ